MTEQRLEGFADLERTVRPDLLWWQRRLVEGMRRMQVAEQAWLNDVLTSVKARPAVPAGTTVADGAAT
ncbi:hypothetical protein [Pseudonocardia xishanensis]|uniref:Uncharacterized protein n=1 Tax=Pseudonocardia xishanensis TaxID=630995 RepID=A0ABP8RIE2_9PSEU